MPEELKPFAWVYETDAQRKLQAAGRKRRVNKKRWVVTQVPKGVRRVKPLPNKRKGV